MIIIILLCISIGFSLYYIYSGKYNKTKTTNEIKNIEKEDYIEDAGNYFRGTIYNGFREYGLMKDISIEIDKDHIYINFPNDIKIIDLDSIEDYRIQTETQIIERASLLKTAAFGIFSLGMKGKEEELVKEYVYIQCNYDGNETYIIMNLGNFNSNFIKKIKEYM